MITKAPTVLYRIGVDVGGTNTDAALAQVVDDLSRSGPPSQPRVEIVASHKARTTFDVTSGICNAVAGLLESTQVPRSDLLSVNIGTTHFLNAIIQVDVTKLERVAVLRLCGPYARDQAPFTEFPRQLKAALEGHVGFLSGGLNIDGRLIAKVNPDEVREHAQIIRDKGIKSVVVVGIFSALDSATPTQEEHARSILEECIPGIDVVCSRDMGAGGLVERENQSILNASVLKHARETIASFEEAMVKLGLDCPLYLTQNDGTIMSAEIAAKAPIRTFSSGPTNSLTGAVFLSGLDRADSPLDLKQNQVIMIDIGGTSADFAALSPTGFPRESASIVKVGGVRTSFSMPEVLSLGLGGGSMVRQDGDIVTVGPESVGYKLVEDSLCFGGSVMTATDIVVASGEDVGIVPQWKDGPPTEEVVKKARAYMTKLLQKGIDSMKTSDLDVVALLVGGGSIIQIDPLPNVRECMRVPFFDAANAVGAAIAKVAGEIDRIVIPTNRETEDEILQSLKKEAIQLAVENGAHPDLIKVVQMDVFQLPYISMQAVRGIVKAVGPPRWEIYESDKAERPVREGTSTLSKSPLTNGHSNASKHSVYQEVLEIDPLTDPSLKDYKPDVCKKTGEWRLSEIDLAFIAEGVGVIGCGGGGSPRPTYLKCLDVLRKSPPGKMRIVRTQDLPDSAQVVPLALVGAPVVSNERLAAGTEFTDAADVLAKYLNIEKYDALIGPEIGGANGMVCLAAGALLDVGVVDADCLGRAFPKIDLSLPYVYDESVPWPAAMCDGSKNFQIMVKAENFARFENIARALATETGSASAIALAPMSKEVVRDYCVNRSLSVCWSIGRTIHLARVEHKDVSQAIIASIPGAFEIAVGKITKYIRKERNGWCMGEVVIQVCNEDGEPINGVETEIMLQFQNEYLYAAVINPDGSKTLLCTTPDLITLLDVDGNALGCHELKYGLRVMAIGMPAHPLWMTERALKASDPVSFGIDMPYLPLEAKWKEPICVIGEYGQ